jgi:hypothetical protein
LAPEPEWTTSIHALEEPLRWWRWWTSNQSQSQVTSFSNPKEANFRPSGNASTTHGQDGASQG